MMSVYRELVLFDGAHFAHCAAWEEHLRLSYLRKRSLNIIARN